MWKIEGVFKTNGACKVRILNTNKIASGKIADPAPFDLARAESVIIGGEESPNRFAALSGEISARVFAPRVRLRYS
jgi:hypothetical protein